MDQCSSDPPACSPVICLTFCCWPRPCLVYLCTFGQCLLIWTNCLFWFSPNMAFVLWIITWTCTAQEVTIRGFVSTPGRTFTLKTSPYVLVKIFLGWTAGIWFWLFHVRFVCSLFVSIGILLGNLSIFPLPTNKLEWNFFFPLRTHSRVCVCKCESCVFPAMEGLFWAPWSGINAGWEKIDRSRIFSCHVHSMEKSICRHRSLDWRF